MEEKSLFEEINNLINKKKLVKFQKLNYKNFYLTHEYVSNLLDKIRNKYLVKKINISIKKILKIMHITNFNYRFDGRLHYNTGRRLNNGFVRLGHNVLTVSDRDIIHNNKSFKDLSGGKFLQNSIIKNYNNFKPDLVVLGHADSVSNETLHYMKKIHLLLNGFLIL